MNVNTEPKRRSRVKRSVEAELLRRARKSVGLLQRDVARELGVTRRRVTVWENDGASKLEAFALLGFLASHGFLKAAGMVQHAIVQAEGLKSW